MRAASQLPGKEPTDVDDADDASHLHVNLNANDDGDVMLIDM